MKRRGFTLVELLTVLAIITLLVGLLVPSLSMVRRVAKETKQKAMLTAIGAALATFRNDYGDYPFSQVQYRGAMVDATGGGINLAEAMFGQDLRGFHPYTDWLAGSVAYGLPNPPPENLQERKSPYLDASAVGIFRIADLYARVLAEAPADFFLAPGAFVICDVFAKQKLTIADGSTTKAGSPILYYKANLSSRRYDGVVAGGPPEEAQKVIYNWSDNQHIIETQGRFDGFLHPLTRPDFFYGDPPAIPWGYIQDPRPAHPWPYRPDSYLLITAGFDGIYGTPDDIKNFGS